jgi:hypothetical protein
MKQWVLILLVHCVLCQIDIAWEPCQTISSTVEGCTAQWQIPIVDAECGTANVPYIPADPNSINITYSIKKYVAEEGIVGSIVVLGDLIIVRKQTNCSDLLG